MKIEKRGLHIQSGPCLKGQHSKEGLLLESASCLRDGHREEDLSACAHDVLPVLGNICFCSQAQHRIQPWTFKCTQMS